jgi:hypothetical protein
VSLQTNTVQANIRTTGAAMSLIKKIDVPKHFAARRALHLAAARTVTPPVATGAPAIGHAGTRGNAAKFIEDFSLEPSSSSTAVSPKE